MTLSISESQAINAMAKILYPFLPGNAHPFANQSISFAGVANDLRLSPLWTAGSKLPAITTLLEKTLEHHRDRFCDLIKEVVRRAVIYRKGTLTREEIQELNKIIEQVQFKIPELWDSSFLSSLPSKQPEPAPSATKVTTSDLPTLNQNFMQLMTLPPKPRGFAFEKFLQGLFMFFGLAPHSSFRLVGEQIDGSLQLDGNTYLIEAKWQNEQVGNADLLSFQGKVEAKSAWARGLIVSYSGFSKEGLIAFARGRATNIIAMDGQDLYFILEGKMSLTDAIKLKSRRAVETGQILVNVQELILEYPFHH